MVKPANNIWGPKLGSIGSKSSPKLFFCHFFKFGSLDFLDTAQDCSLGQCLTSNRAET